MADATALRTPTTRTSRMTRGYLTAGTVAGPLWAAVALGQAATRDGFDLTRHPLSLLSNGALGWLQVTNFLLVGVLVVAGAAGLRRMMSGSPGGTWAPRLVALYGLGMVAAGALTLDPADGFPAGTPLGAPTSLSLQGGLHLAAGMVSFTALIVACFVLARHLSRAGAPSLAARSRVAGVALLIGNGWAMSGGRAGSLTLAVGAIIAMLWVSRLSWHLRQQA